MLGDEGQQQSVCLRCSVGGWEGEILRYSDNQILGERHLEKTFGETQILGDTLCVSLLLDPRGVMGRGC